MTKFHIVFRSKLPHDYKVPDFFDTVGEAERFIRNWDLGKYNPEIIRINKENEHLENAELYTKGSDMYSYNIHQGMLQEFNDRIENNSKQEYDLTDDGTGKKYDTGKSMVGTAVRIFASALLGIGACITFGQSKYPKSDNWKLVENGMDRYTDSLIRHLTKFHSGEEVDPETKLPHLFHCGWNMLAIIEFYIKDHPELLKEIRK